MYLNPILEPGKNNLRVKKIEIAKLRLASIEFDGFVGVGISGALVGSALAVAMNKPLTIIRKDTDTDNHGCRVEGPRELARYIFVDDLISTGTTYRRVRDSVELFKTSAWPNKTEARVIGAYIFNSDRYEEYTQ